MATYEHGGITITFDERGGKFTATIGGKRQVAASLSGIKKKIDDAAASTFKPFGALIWRTTYDRSKKDVKEIQVVGIIKARGKYGYSAKDQWEVACGDEYAEVMVDTPENRAAIKTYLDLQRINSKASEKMGEAESKLLQKIVAISPESK